ncbi:hypothetical protein PanWU01x14_251440, partial [Parasponia andersonii]
LHFTFILSVDTSSGSMCRCHLWVRYSGYKEGN